MNHHPTTASTYLPAALYIGAGAALNLATLLQRYNSTKPLIITDPTLLALGHIDKIKQSLEAQGLQPAIFSNTVAEPTVSSIIAGITVFKSQAYDAIIAVGGGSVIDSAKAINVMGSHGGNVQDYRVPHEQTLAGVPLIAVPTTAGTGSEATQFTVITDDKTHEKLLCRGTAYVPDAAVIDYTLTLSMPARVTADSGIDALTHAIEAYVSRRANPYSDTQALAALRLLGPNLRIAFHDGANTAAREAMMVGATLAGVAFSSSSVALVHGMSRPIGAFFAVPHGLSNAMLLPTVTQYSIPSAPQRYADCARAMGIVEASGDDLLACEALLLELNNINDDLAVPTLSDFGVDKAQYLSLCEEMANQAMASGSPGNNPVIPSIEDMKALYIKAYC